MSVAHSLLRHHALCPGIYAKQNEGYLRMRKLSIQINSYFLIKTWQMRNVSTQNREKYLFLFFFNFSQTITHTYIVDSVSGFKSENSQLWSFFNSYSIRHAAEMWLSYIFWFTKWKKSSLVILFFELYTACSKNRTYIAHFFRFRDWKSSSLINLYLVLNSARMWIATNILS